MATLQDAIEEMRGFLAQTKNEHTVSALQRAISDIEAKLASTSEIESTINSENGTSGGSEDAAEMKRLLGRAKRPGVKAWLRAQEEELRSVDAVEAPLGSSSKNVPEVPTAAPEAKLTPVANCTKTTALPANTASSARTPSSSHAPAQVAMGVPPSIPKQYVSIQSFAFDGNGQKSTVEVYISEGMDGVKEAAKDRVTCTFEPFGFDLKVLDFNGKDYRMRKIELQKEIIPEQSKAVVKKNSIVLKLKKKKGEDGTYDYWPSLTHPKGKTRVEDINKKNPSAGIMEMMKDLYNDGDEKTRKMIGKAMQNRQDGKVSDPNDFADDY